MLILFHSFTVTNAVSWEDWWTYDGISGKLCEMIIPNQSLKTQDKSLEG